MCSELAPAEQTEAADTEEGSLSLRGYVAGESRGSVTLPWPCHQPYPDLCLKIALA